MASTLHASCIATYVETPIALRMSDADRERLAHNLRLAEQLGAEAVTLKGENAAQETVRYARTRNVTKIVLGKPTHPRWRDVFRQSFLEEIVRTSGDIDVYVISGEDPGPAPVVAPRQAGDIELLSYGASAGVSVAATLAAWFLFGRRQLADVVMIYLLGIILVSLRFGYGPSVCAAVLSVLMLDFFFVPPYLSFAVSDFQHVVTFGVMFVVAVVISNLTQRVRLQADSARYRERRTSMLYSMSRELAATRATRNLAAVAVEHVHEVFEAKVALFLEGIDGRLENLASGDAAYVPTDKERDVLDWVWSHEKPAGLTTDTLPSAGALYLVLRGAQGRVGVLGVMPGDARRLGSPEQRGLLDVFANQIGSALERGRLAEQAQHAHVEVEGERLRSSLLSSVSHDLRTPLSVITGAASALVESDAVIAPPARRDLAQTIQEEAERLNRLVRNLLDMTRFAAGPVRITKEWQPLDGVVGAAIGRLEGQLSGRNVDTHLPRDLPLVPIDGVLIEQLFINLLENTAKYTPAGSPIEISARKDDKGLVIDVADRGPGIPPDLAQKIFEKFFRLPREREGGGAGLGLAICRAIVEAHGGRIWVDSREGGGAAFHFTVPIEGAPPLLSAEEAR
jgi:two-component system sensor histidine kinase KdpD